LGQLSAAERLNFLLYKRIPRKFCALSTASVSHSENPLLVKAGMAI